MRSKAFGITGGLYANYVLFLSGRGTLITGVIRL